MALVMLNCWIVASRRLQNKERMKAKILLVEEKETSQSTLFINKVSIKFGEKSESLEAILQTLHVLGIEPELCHGNSITDYDVFFGE